MTLLPGTTFIREVLYVLISLNRGPYVACEEPQRWSLSWFLNNKASRNTKRMLVCHQWPHVHMGMEEATRWNDQPTNLKHETWTSKHQTTTKDKEENDQSKNKLKYWYLVCYHKVGQNALKFFFCDAFVLRTRKNSMISTSQHVILFSRKEIV